MIVIFNNYSSYSNHVNRPRYPYAQQVNQYQADSRYQCPNCNYQPNNSKYLEFKDYGPQPFVFDIEEATKLNNNFRTALWTGEHLQLTLMSIPVGGEIGLEIHPNVDQFIRIEEGQGLVKMGESKDNLNYQAKAKDDFAIIIPAGTWHNLINTGDKPIKLYSIYAPPQHPHGTIHRTKEEAEESEMHHMRYNFNKN